MGNADGDDGDMRVGDAACGLAGGLADAVGDGVLRRTTTLKSSPAPAAAGPLPAGSSLSVERGDDAMPFFARLVTNVLFVGSSSLALPRGTDFARSVMPADETAWQFLFEGAPSRGGGCEPPRHLPRSLKKQQTIFTVHHLTSCIC
jgi:hypothetical protein